MIGRGWAKYSDWSLSGKQITYLPKPKEEANNIDLQDTDKSRSFVITEFCKCFIAKFVFRYIFWEAVSKKAVSQFHTISFFQSEGDHLIGVELYMFLIQNCIKLFLSLNGKTNKLVGCVVSVFIACYSLAPKLLQHHQSQQTEMSYTII